MTANVALLGYGLAGSVFHAPFISTTPGLRLSVIVTGNEERREQVGREHPGVEVVGTADEVWERAAELDLAVIATPNKSHLPLGLAALEAGLAVVVDKPLALNAAEARSLVDAAAEHGLMLTAFQNRRWDGDFLTLRRLLDANELGRVHRFESRFERWRPQLGDGWRERTPAAEGGGLLLDLGSHLVDQAVQLFGPVRRALRGGRRAARGRRRGRRRVPRPRARVRRPLAPVGKRARGRSRPTLPRPR